MIDSMLYYFAVCAFYTVLSPQRIVCKLICSVFIQFAFYGKIYHSNSPVKGDVAMYVL